MRIDCWCYATKKTVWIHGKIIGKQQADLLRVDDCEEKECSYRRKDECLINKIREGRWP